MGAAGVLRGVLVAGLLLAGSSEAASGEDMLGVRYIEVVDGDTFRVEDPIAAREINRIRTVRLLGVDTPEMAHRCADADEQAQLRDLAQLAKELVHATLASAERIDLIDVGLDSFGRVLAKVRLNGATDLGGLLLDRRLAKLSEGRRRPKWCES